jgi:hypothetical protein
MCNSYAAGNHLALDVNIYVHTYLKRSKKCDVDYRDVIPNTNISACITCLTTPIEFGISDPLYISFPLTYTNRASKA